MTHGGYHGESIPGFPHVKIGDQNIEGLSGDLLESFRDAGR
jgi:hypothetical protein